MDKVDFNSSFEFIKAVNDAILDGKTVEKRDDIFTLRVGYVITSKSTSKVWYRLEMKYLIKNKYANKALDFLDGVNKKK